VNALIAIGVINHHLPCGSRRSPPIWQASPRVAGLDYFVVAMNDQPAARLSGRDR
jgi:hypothetical protein